ncbi:hypothetical protein OF83DRAFT_1069297 [Amylostereum chailletii]|nr:hypothetical protein OF83DRAFT_1069297 [Amylostereum chailletii]
MGTGRSVKFRVKGSYRKGISLADATASVRLSSSYEYSMHELSLDLRGRMHLQVQWPGYRPLNYEIPVTGYDGMVNMSSFARRLSRAIGHFCQACNRISIPWDRIILQRLDETQLGVWAPTIATI